MKDEFDHGMGLPDDELIESTPTDLGGVEVDEHESEAATPAPGGGRSIGGGRQGSGRSAPRKARPSAPAAPKRPAKRAGARKAAAPKKRGKKAPAKSARKAARKSAPSRKKTGGKKKAKKGGRRR